MPVRYLARNLDYLRVPKNASERADMRGDVPYWGANSVQGYVDRALVNGPVVLVGEDGAPFFDKLARVAFAVNGPIWPNNHVHVLEPRRDVDYRYLAASLNAVDYSLYVKGSTRDKLNQSELSGIVLAVPGPEEQRRLADFLDRETAEIDAFIADQEELVGLLTERRAATITHAVTKGVDSSAPMKYSGVEWLGEVPATWDVLSPRRVFRQRKDLAAPSDKQLAATQEYGVIPQDRYTELTGYRVTQVLKGFEILKHVERGDFVISMRSFQGGLEYAHHAGKISSAYVMLHPQMLIADGFFRYLFKSSGFIAALRSTSNLVRDGQAMRFSNVAQVQIPVPDFSSQTAIADYLDCETSELDATIADAREAIALSKERRAALISAAVTGKIDTRGLA